MLVQEAKLSLG